MAAAPHLGYVTRCSCPALRSLNSLGSATPASRDRETGATAGAGSLLLERVLDLVPGLLDVALGLVGLAFGLQLLIVGGGAHAFLDLALDFGGLVSGLVLGSHDLHRPSGIGVTLPGRQRSTRLGPEHSRLTLGKGTPSWPPSSWACRRSRKAPGPSACPAAGSSRPRW